MVFGAAAVGKLAGGHIHYIHAHQKTVGAFGGIVGRGAGGDVARLPAARRSIGIVGGDYQQIHIGILAVVAAGAGAEQDYRHRAHRIVNRLGDGPGPGVAALLDRGLRHTGYSAAGMDSRFCRNDGGMVLIAAPGCQLTGNGVPGYTAANQFRDASHIIYEGDAMRLQGKVALITGGARGQGAAEARLFAREGAKVVIADVLDPDGMSVAAAINELGGDATYVHLDVSRESDWQDAIAAAVAAYGKLDVLVNNAAIWRGGHVLDTGGDQWDAVLDINAKGVFLGTKLAIPEMRRAGGGSIVNISSTAGLVGSHTSTAYSASKGAVRLFTKSTAVQYGAENIRANSIHPGPIDTPMGDQVWPDADSREETIDRTVLKRIGTPEDIANGALFLASDESSFMTGAELVIDGGLTAQ